MRALMPAYIADQKFSEFPSWRSYKWGAYELFAAVRTELAFVAHTVTDNRFYFLSSGWVAKLGQTRVTGHDNATVGHESPPSGVSGQILILVRDGFVR